MLLASISQILNTLQNVEFKSDLFAEFCCYENEENVQENFRIQMKNFRVSRWHSASLHALEIQFVFEMFQKWSKFGSCEDACEIVPSEYKGEIADCSDLYVNSSLLVWQNNSDSYSWAAIYVSF